MYMLHITEKQGAYKVVSKVIHFKAWVCVRNTWSCAVMYTYIHTYIVFCIADKWRKQSVVRTHLPKYTLIITIWRLTCLCTYCQKIRKKSCHDSIAESDEVLLSQYTLIIAEWGNLIVILYSILLVRSITGNVKKKKTCGP